MWMKFAEPYQLASGKAPGIDGLPAEVFKAGGLNLITKLTHLFQNIWNKRSVPQEFRDALIVHIFKRNGDHSVCDDHCGISLLSITGKILGRVILSRLSKHVDEIGILPESQCGFGTGRSTMDMIFTARQLHEKCREQQREMYAVFVLTKAFDSVDIRSRSTAPQTLSPSSAPSMKACGQVSLRTVKYLPICRL